MTTAIHPRRHVTHRAERTEASTMSNTGICRGRFSLTSLIIVLVFVVIGYFIYNESTAGGYTEWSKWSECSKSCGEGLRGRSRKCTAPKPGMIGRDCQGSPYMTEKCSVLTHCPVDGGFTEWGSYGECDKTCGGGTKVRIRRCTNPAPEYGGKPCEGNGFEKMDCNVNPCPVNGGFSAWGEYSKCEITGEKNCGKGKHVRTRTCNNPVPQHGGKNCEGPASETTECEVPCPTTPSRNTTTASGNTTTSNTISTPVSTTKAS